MRDVNNWLVGSRYMTCMHAHIYMVHPFPSISILFGTMLQNRQSFVWLKLPTRYSRVLGAKEIDMFDAKFDELYRAV